LSALPSASILTKLRLPVTSSKKYSRRILVRLPRTAPPARNPKRASRGIFWQGDQEHREPSLGSCWFRGRSRSVARSRAERQRSTSPRRSRGVWGREPGSRICLALLRPRPGEDLAPIAPRRPGHVSRTGHRQRTVERLIQIVPSRHNLEKGIKGPERLALNVCARPSEGENVACMMRPLPTVYDPDLVVRGRAFAGGRYHGGGVEGSRQDHFVAFFIRVFRSCTNVLGSIA
jgi:hypothetical protein